MAEAELRAALEAMNQRLAQLDHTGQTQAQENARLAVELARMRADAAAAAPSTPAPTSSLVDTRMISKPQVFAGVTEHGGDWACVFRAYCAAIHPRMTDLMQAAQDANELVVPTNASDIALSNQLYYILALSVKDRALEKLRATPVGNGFECWRNFCDE